MTIEKPDKYPGYSRHRVIKSRYSRKPVDDPPDTRSAERKELDRRGAIDSVRRIKDPERRKRTARRLGISIEDSTQIDSEGLDTLVEAYIRSNAQLAFVIAEALKTMVVARPGGGTDVKKLDPKTGKTTKIRTITDRTKAANIRRAAEKRVKGERTFGRKPNGEEFSFVHVPKRRQPTEGN